ncbi:MAG TPA: Glu/Leu/Phe/Val dehydrogenase dimerization domain-containing protein [Verrucomicrobiae bacterium]|nr:Glu/Leu/Phe/Val dehydrogenase dimerization domain-containing protein [Verrucomicrobiae bacterium]
MPVFKHPEFDNHELVAHHADPRTGLRAIIAVHNTALGKGLGGCRMWPYGSEDEALTDVLRLSRGMTYKAALADLPQGGGKSVILGDPRRDKTPEMMRAMGRFVDSLGGKYVVAEDSGTSVADIHVMAEETKHVGGLADEKSAAAGRTGDPSPATAYGTYVGILAAVRAQLGRADVKGLRVAIQGVGNVGYRLAKHLHEGGAQLWVTDIHPPAVERCVKEFGATAVPMEAIFTVAADVFAPCALGAVINDRTLPLLRAGIVAGAANNQLAEPRHGRMLMEKGVLYAPDYVINAGGIIDIHYEGPGYDPARVKAHLDLIGTTLATVFERSRMEQRPTGEIADRMAEERFRK